MFCRKHVIANDHRITPGFYQLNANEGPNGECFSLQIWYILSQRECVDREAAHGTHIQSMCGLHPVNIVNALSSSVLIYLCHLWIGGWWTRPSNWRMNTAIASAGIFAIAYATFRYSAEREVKPHLQTLVYCISYRVLIVEIRGASEADPFSVGMLFCSMTAAGLN
jgi:hypothetical protein